MILSRVILILLVPYIILNLIILHFQPLICLHVYLLIHSILHHVLPMCFHLPKWRLPYHHLYLPTKPITTFLRPTISLHTPHHILPRIIPSTLPHACYICPHPHPNTSKYTTHPSLTTKL